MKSQQECSKFYVLWDKFTHKYYAMDPMDNKYQTSRVMDAMVYYDEMLAYESRDCVGDNYTVCEVEVTYLVKEDK